MKKNYLKLLVIVSAVVLLSSCTVCRGIKQGGPKITAHKHFVHDTIRHSAQPFVFAQGNEPALGKLRYSVKSKKGDVITKMSLDSLLETNTPTTAFLVIRNDSVLFEQYYRGYDAAEPSTIFSVSKSLSCLLAEIAMDEGLIASIDDPVIKYVPGFAEKDPRRGKVTVRHLMDMRAGIKFKETYKPNPFAAIARLFYGNDAYGQIRKLKIEVEPGTQSHYQSIATNVLGLVIEKATGMPLYKYMETKVWQPLGMEHDALLSVDNKKSRVPKAFGGFAATATDLAKIGRLYLNNGNWNGTQIIDSKWAKTISTPNVDNFGYQLSWRILRESIPVSDTSKNVYFADSLSVVARINALGADLSDYAIVHGANSGPNKDKWIGVKFDSGVYYALGILGQVIYVNPEKKIIMVRLGRKDKNHDYPYFMHRLASSL